MVDHSLQKVIIVRKRSRVWRMIQFAVVTIVMLIALMNVFVWQIVISSKDVAALIIVGFLYFVTFLECFNFYHYHCPLCGMEHKSSDFDVGLSRKCVNCGHEFIVHFIDRG